MCRWRRKEVWPRGKGIAWGRGLPEETRGRRNLCVVPCHNCCIYGTWRSRELEEEGKVLKSSYGECKSQKGRSIFKREINLSRRHANI